MRTAVLVTLIVCGTVLVVTPAVVDHLHERAVVEMATQITRVPEGLSFTIPEAMKDTYRFALWLTGRVTIGCGVIGGFAGGRRDERRAQAG